MESTNESIDIIDNFSFVMNFFSIGNIGIAIILNDILLFSFTFAGGLIQLYFVSTFTYNLIKPYRGLFEGRGLILNI